jgi:hypothetical protein
MVSAVPTLRKICINKTHRNKTLHLLVEINNYVVEGLVDIKAFMSVMRCDSRTSLLARTLASPCFGREPKAKVVTIYEFELSPYDMGCI